MARDNKRRKKRRKLRKAKERQELENKHNQKPKPRPRKQFVAEGRGGTEVKFEFSGNAVAATPDDQEELLKEYRRLHGLPEDGASS